MIRSGCLFSNPHARMPKVPWETLRLKMVKSNSSFEKLLNLMHVSHLSVLSRKFTPIANSFSPSAPTVVRDYLSDSRSKWICKRSSSWALCRKIPALPQPSLEPNRTNKRMRQMVLPAFVMLPPGERPRMIPRRRAKTTGAQRTKSALKGVSGCKGA